MTTDQVRRLPPAGRLAYYVREREEVRLRKEAGRPAPWTDDEILRRYRFTNVRRMDDAVSRWLLEHWYGPYRDHPNTLAAAALARHFNLPSVLEWITDLVFHRGRVEWSKIKEVVRERKALGFKVFNGAYMVRGIGTSDKTEMVVDRVVRPLHEAGVAVDAGSMRKTWEALLPHWGFSSFMAGQVVADLRHALTGGWSDRRSWAPLGPGSRRGLNRYLGRELSAPVSQQEFERGLGGVIRHLILKLPRSVTGRLEAMDYQNCLCEFDKYERTLWGQGKPKQRYPGGG